MLKSSHVFYLADKSKMNKFTGYDLCGVVLCQLTAQLPLDVIIQLQVQNNLAKHVKSVTKNTNFIVTVLMKMTALLSSMFLGSGGAIICSVDL